MHDNGPDPGSESESDSDNSGESDGEGSSKSEGSINGCDQGANVHEEEASRTQSRNGDSSTNNEVDVGLKGRSNSGIVEAVVCVRNSEDIATVVATAKYSVSVIKIF